MRFLCEIIKGESQAEHTERESEILRDGERGREKRWRERVRRWFLSKTVIFGFDHRPKSTRDILRYRYWSYLHKVISRRLQILKSLVRRYFYFPTVSGAHDLCSNNSDVFHIILNYVTDFWLNANFHLLLLCHVSLLPRDKKLK